MSLSPEARKARADYYRAWCLKNPEKVKEHQKKYWERKAKEAAEKAEKGEQADKT